MNLTFEQFKALVTQLHTLECEANTYLDQVPSDLSGAIFDNTYTNVRGIMFDAVFQNLFGIYAEDVYWLLYDCQLRGETISIEGREYSITSLDSYFEYASAELEFSDLKH